jgi:hypothetical protein
MFREMRAASTSMSQLLHLFAIRPGKNGLSGAFEARSDARAFITRFRSTLELRPKNTGCPLVALRDLLPA